MKKAAYESEARYSACFGQFFAMPIANIFSIICFCIIFCSSKSPNEIKARRQGAIKSLYILSMAYYITVLVIQGSVLYVVLNDKYKGLIGMLIPVTFVTIAGIWYTRSSFIAYEMSYWEEVLDEKDCEIPIRNPVETPKENFDAPKFLPEEVTAQQDYKEKKQSMLDGNTDSKGLYPSIHSFHKVDP